MPTTERRQIPRTTLDRLAYIHIEPNNGGIVLNVSNDGLCFHCIAAVEKNGPLRFSLLEHNRHIAACGELAWTDEVHKVAGVRFTTLTAEARQQVQDWISQPAVPLEEHSSTLGSALLKAFPRFRIRRSDRNLDSSSSSGFTPAFPKLRVRIRTKAGGFGGGLTTGLLVSALWASGFLLYAHRRDLGQSLIHLGEHLSGERSSPERLDGAPLSGRRPAQEPVAEARLAEEPPAAKPKTAKPPAVLAPPMRPPKEAPSRAHAQAPAAAISRLSSIPVRTQTPAENSGKLLARPLAVPAKPQPVTLKPQLSTHIASSPANSSAPQRLVERSASGTAAPAPITASLAAPESPIANPIPNKIAAPPASAPASTVQVHNTFPASAVPLPQMYFELGKFKDELRARDLGKNPHESVVPRL